MTDDLTHVFRQEHGRCVATLIRVLGDVDLAEDAVAEAFAIAAETWPRTGLPPNPGAWITTTARNRAIDRLRREASRDERHLAAHRLHETTMEPNPLTAELDTLVDVVPDDQLRLMFLCCHPALAPDAQVALTLRLLGGFETPDIAAAFLTPQATMAQRIVRAKRKLRDNRAPYRIPSVGELPDRLNAVLAAISLLFTAGHTAARGAELIRVDLCAEAIRLARVLVGLMPDEPEAAGLLALLLLTDARRAARVDAEGQLVRLADQDRGLWDTDRIREGHALVRACLRRNRPGRFQFQAAIAAVHADAPSADRTDWGQIVALYDQLYAQRPDPVVAINRAIAVGELHGPAVGLRDLDRIESGRVENYQPYHATRADLLARCGRPAEARTAYERAIRLSDNEVERTFLRRQRDRAELR